MPLIRAMARTSAIAGTATAVSGRVAHRQQDKWDQQAEQAPPAAAAPAAPAAGADEITQIRTLAGLVDDGILSPRDFVAKVKQMVGM